VVVAAALLVASALAGVSIGAVRLPPGGVLATLLDAAGGGRVGVEHLGIGHRLPTLQAEILLAYRLPRVVLAALVGGMLAVAGASYQGVFRNPLADPYLLGAAAGAGLGATLEHGRASGGDPDGSLRRGPDRGRSGVCPRRRRRTVRGG
jgi:iron complex transport system permease protein